MMVNLIKIPNVLSHIASLPFSQKVTLFPSLTISRTLSFRPRNFLQQNEVALFLFDILLLFLHLSFLFYAPFLNLFANKKTAKFPFLFCCLSSQLFIILNQSILPVSTRTKPHCIKSIIHKLFYNIILSYDFLFVNESMVLIFFLICDY